MKLTNIGLAVASISSGFILSASTRVTSQNVIPFVPLGINNVYYQGTEYKSDLLYTNVDGKTWLICVAGVYKAEIVDEKIIITEKLTNPVSTECP